MRRFCLVLAIALSGFTPALAAPAAANNTPKGPDLPFNATYGLYTGGMRMIDVEASFDLGSAYHIKTDARTTGIFSKLLPWSGTFETTGAAGFRPSLHDYTVSWRDRVEKSTFTYDPPGVFKDMVLTKADKEPAEPFDPEIAKDTRDLLSSVGLLFRQVGETGSCTLDVLTFDNARSFILRFSDAGNITLQNATLSSYQGPAHGCKVEIIPQKGKWPKKPRGWLRIQEQAKKDGKLPILWLARPKPDMPVIPVRVDIHTKYGDVIAHLTNTH